VTRPALTTGALGPSIVSLNENKSSSLWIVPPPPPPLRLFGTLESGIPPPPPPPRCNFPPERCDLPIYHRRMLESRTPRIILFKSSMLTAHIGGTGISASYCCGGVCCLLVLNLLSSTLSCIRQPRPRLTVSAHPPGLEHQRCGLGWRIHGSVEDTKLSTNKQHSLSETGPSPTSSMNRWGGERGARAE